MFNRKIKREYSVYDSIFSFDQTYIMIVMYYFSLLILFTLNRRTIRSSIQRPILVFKTEFSRFKVILLMLVILKSRKINNYYIVHYTPLL